VRVAAARNGSEFAVLLEWSDASLDDRFGHSDRYSDKAALMFPVSPSKEPPAITMGDEAGPVNVWQWQAVWERDLRNKGEKRNRGSAGPSAPMLMRDSSVMDLNAEGFSTLSSQEDQDVAGKAVWKDNVWRLVFKRSLKTADVNDVQIKHSLTMAIAIWNGANRERNGQKGISSWTLLRFM